MGLWTSSGSSGGAGVAAAGAAAVAVAGVVGFQVLKPKEPVDPTPPPAQVATLPTEEVAPPITPPATTPATAPDAGAEPVATPEPAQPVSPPTAPAVDGPPATVEAPAPEAPAEDPPVDPAVDTAEAARPAPEDVADGTASEAIEPEPASPTAPAEVAAQPVPNTPAPSDPAVVAPSDEGTEPAPQEDAVKEEEVAVLQPAPEPQPEPVAAPMPSPIFDLMRVDALGGAIVAGQSQAMSRVDVLLDGTAVADAQADRSGKFVALFDVAPSSQPRLITLRASNEAGQSAVSEESMIVAPFAPVVAAAPEVEAEDTAPAPEAEEPTAGAESVEPAPPAILVADDDGVRLLDPVTPGAPVNVSVDTISYDPTGGVRLQGRGGPGHTVRIYLDNRLRAEASVGTDGGWATPLEDVAPGVYTLRADELDAAAKVVSRFETPFLREERAAIAAAAGAPSADPDAPTDPVGGSDTPAPAAAAAETPPQTPPQSTARATAGAPDTGTPPAVTEQVSVITVQPGSTLWAIAREQYGDGVMYVRVYEANKDQIGDPDLIYPGQVFDLPE